MKVRYRRSVCECTRARSPVVNERIQSHRVTNSYWFRENKNAKKILNYLWVDFWRRAHDRWAIRTVCGRHRPWPAQLNTLCIVDFIKLSQLPLPPLGCGCTTEYITRATTTTTTTTAIARVPVFTSDTIQTIYCVLWLYIVETMKEMRSSLVRHFNWKLSRRQQCKYANRTLSQCLCVHER